MTRAQKSDEIVDMLTEVLDIPANELSDDTGPGSHGEWTSRKHMELVVEIEERYGISLTHREIRGLRTVAAVRETLRAKGVTEAGT
jgi:acyl carrier protein